MKSLIEIVLLFHVITHFPTLWNSQSIRKVIKKVDFFHPKVGQHEKRYEWNFVWRKTIFLVSCTFQLEYVCLLIFKCFPFSWNRGQLYKTYVELFTIKHIQRICLPSLRKTTWSNRRIFLVLYHVALFLKSRLDHVRVQPCLLMFLSTTFHFNRSPITIYSFSKNQLLNNFFVWLYLQQKYCDQIKLWEHCANLFPMGLAQKTHLYFPKNTHICRWDCNGEKL